MDAKMPVVGFLAGNDVSSAFIESVAVRAGTLLAADSASLGLLELGFRPVVIGDFDSVSRDQVGGCECIVDTDQDKSDCDKLLIHAKKLGSNPLFLCGLEGDDPGHSLAVYSCIVNSGVPCILVYRRHTGVLISPKLPLDAQVAKGTSCSFIPLVPSSFKNVAGLKWNELPTSNGIGDRVSVSNEVVSRVNIELAIGLVLALFERDKREDVLWVP